jgi:protein-S-isoprenylcysteine O-methyltransferase Ste14
MNWRLVRTILILPGTVLIVVPGTLLWFAAGGQFAARLAGPDALTFWLAAVASAGALALMVGTVALFVRVGRGTPAPWDPPQNLVIRGPYRHVRNPMISGAALFLAAEALMLRSWPVAAWMAVFLAINAVYFPLFEEPGLERRFGDPYRRYKAKVPRWIPRLTPWEEADP